MASSGSASGSGHRNHRTTISWIDQPFTERSTFSVKVTYSCAMGDGSHLNMLATAYIIEAYTGAEVAPPPNTASMGITIKESGHALVGTSGSTTRESVTYKWHSFCPTDPGTYFIRIVVSDIFGTQHGSTTSEPFTVQGQALETTYQYSSGEAARCFKG